MPQARLGNLSLISLYNLYHRLILSIHKASDLMSDISHPFVCHYGQERGVLTPRLETGVNH